MEATIKIDDRKNFQSLINFLKSVKIDVISSEEPMQQEQIKSEIPKSKFTSWADFEKHLGIWQGRNITKETLRKRAWRIR